MLNLNEKPFYLNAEDVDWVNKTLTSMSDEEKIGQLFCLIGWDSEETNLKSFTEKYHVGGLMCRPMPAER
jgi:beta-N-acetylhexosaminidase